MKLGVFDPQPPKPKPPRTSATRSAEADALRDSPLADDLGAPGVESEGSKTSAPPPCLTVTTLLS